MAFETYYIKPNPHLFFRQQNMQWSYNMVHSHIFHKIQLYHNCIVRSYDEIEATKKLKSLKVSLYLLNKT
jgi:hypothetical protein